MLTDEIISVVPNVRACMYIYKSEFQLELQDLLQEWKYYILGSIYNFFQLTSNDMKNQVTDSLV